MDLMEMVCGGWECLSLDTWKECRDFLSPAERSADLPLCSLALRFLGWSGPKKELTG